MEAKDFINKRTGLGVAALGFVGFLFGGPAGAGVGALMGAALANLSPPSRKGEMTPERQSLYNTAMNSTSTPAELREMADSFASEGLAAEAHMLRKRAELRELPREVRDQRRQAYRQMMCSDDVGSITEMARAFAEEGALGSSTGCRQHAADVQAAHEAGKSAKPVADQKVIDAFADKLAKAIYHFKPASREALTAAANLLRARGQAPTRELADQVVAACVAEMSIPETAAGTTEEVAEAAAEDVAAPAVAASEDAEVTAGEEPVDTSGESASAAGEVSGEEVASEDHTLSQGDVVPSAAPAG